MQRYPQKQGDTFSLAGTVTLPQANWTPSAKVRDSVGNALTTCAVTLAPPDTPPVSGDWTYSILIEAPSTQTASWPEGANYCDVRFTDDSTPPVVETSPTFAIDVSAAQSG